MALFWGGDSSHSKIIFKIQKTIIIGVVVGSSSRDACHELFKNSEVMPLQSQYIFSLLLFFVRNRELFRSNSDVHNCDTRCNSDLHLPIANFNSISRGSVIFWT
jgi:hypothetical protein